MLLEFGLSVRFISLSGGLPLELGCGWSSLAFGSLLWICLHGYCLHNWMQMAWSSPTRTRLEKEPNRGKRGPGRNPNRGKRGSISIHILSSRQLSPTRTRMGRGRFFEVSHVAKLGTSLQSRRVANWTLNAWLEQVAYQLPKLHFQRTKNKTSCPLKTRNESNILALS